jgi:hypothetical protein
MLLATIARLNIVVAASRSAAHYHRRILRPFAKRTIRLERWDLPQGLFRSWRGGATKRGWKCAAVF